MLGALTETAAFKSVGSGTLHGTWNFDLENGREAQTGDLFWAQDTDKLRRMVPMWSATLCILGPANFDQLALSTLKRLMYVTTPIPANVGGPNLLTNGAVFAVKTRSGYYAKVQVLQYGYDLQIRWVTFDFPPPQYLDAKITLGSAPAWLVTRYAVECTYKSAGGTLVACGSGIYGPEGGIMQGKVSDDSIAYPPSVSVTITVDFEPGTGLKGLVKNFAPPVTDTGVNFLFEPNQVIQNTNLFFDLPKTCLSGDYFLIRWNHIVGTDTVASGQQYLDSAQFTQPVTQYCIVFVPDPIYAKSVKIDIIGRYQGLDLVAFSQSFELSDKAILLRAQPAGAAQSYTLVAS